MDKKLKNLLRVADEWIESHKGEFVTELQALTRIPSISRADLAEEGAPFGPECRRVLDFALERGRHYGFETMDNVYFIDDTVTIPSDRHIEACGSVIRLTEDCHSKSMDLAQT